MDTSETPVFMPDYCRDFYCIADRCRHSCCIGWEIDIDDLSLTRFRSVTGPLSKKLRESIEEAEDGTAHFILQGDAERCPFLNKDNLCELILDLGEDSLCDICREHPRFRNFFSIREEVGLGLCCEEAARLLLIQRGPIRLVECMPMPAGSEPKEADDLEQAFFQYREDLFRIVFDGSLSLSEQLTALSGKEKPLLSSSDLSRWGSFLKTLERLDSSWDEELKRLQNTVTDPDISGFDAYMKECGREAEYRNLLWYFLFRHLTDGLIYEEGDTFEECLPELQKQVLFAQFSVELLHCLGACHWAEKGEYSLDDQIGIVRLYSSEIEYSDENVEQIIDHFSQI